MKELQSYIIENEKISIRHQCELIEISRSTVYYEPVGESEGNLKIMRLMDENYLEHPTAGVLQIMAIYPKRNLSKLGNAKYIRPYLLRNLKIDHPNYVWAIDITYIPMAHGFMYLTAIIDIYSRFVVGWDVFNSLDAENSLEVLKRAIDRYGKPEIINSDQGSQFTCALWTEYADNAEIKISMDGKGRAIDNIFIERLWRTTKQDYVYLHPAENGSALYSGLKIFFIYYNTQKSHQGIGRITPEKLYRKAA
jgi:putative transposase